MPYALPHALLDLARPAPCCARITPTRTGDWRAALDRLMGSLRGALRAAAPRPQEPGQLPELDGATMRDLGLSHAAAAWTAREQ